MPIKQVTCSLCNKTVNKAATYALANGTRACRSHEEAQSFAESHKKEETLRLKKMSEKTPAQMRKEKWQAEFGSDPRPVTPLVPKCFCCGREGLHQQDFYFRVLMAMEKMDLLGVDRPLPFSVSADGAVTSNPEYGRLMREYMKSPDMNGDYIYVCLSLVPLEQNRQIKSHSRYDARFAADATGFAMICPKCIEKYRVQLPDKFSELTFDQIKNWSVAAELTKPIRQEAAAAEIAEMAGK